MRRNCPHLKEARVRIHQLRLSAKSHTRQGLEIQHFCRTEARLMFKFSFRRFLSLSLILALVLTASFGSSGQAAAAGEVGLAKAIAAQEAHTNSIMSIDGVIGTAVGRGAGGGHIVLALTTAQGVRGIPGAVDGVIVRPLVTGEINALKGKPGSGVDAKARFTRPVPIGVSTGHPDITAGTIGARVTDGSNVYALSNNHVYANSNAASDNDPVLQPGPTDGGKVVTDVIRTLSDYQTIVFGGPDNVIDAAIALTNTSLVGTDTPSDGYGAPSSSDIAPLIDMNVQKYGRTTGLTKSNITAINATVNVNYGTSVGVAKFVQQIIVAGGKFSDGGDSGSLIVTDDANKNPVGLLFAGSNSYTIGNPIGAVLTRFGVTVDDGQGPPAATGSIVGTVTDADGGILGATVTTGSGHSADTDINGDYEISGVAEGATSVTASADGYATSAAVQVTVDELVDADADFLLTAVESGSESTVASITYSLSGGRSGTKHVLIDVAIADDLGSDVEGAVVTVSVFRNGNFFGGASAPTGGDGIVTFQASNAPPGTYTTEVDNVVATGLTWDGVTPANSFDK